MIKRLEKLLDAATPGPWSYEWNDRDDHEAGIDIMAAPPNGRVALVELSHFGEPTRAEAELIAAAVNALPALLAVVEAAREVSTFRYCTKAVCDDYIWQRNKSCLSEALAKLDEVQP